jgi:hypothetical protein
MTLDYTCATGLLVVTSQVTAVTAPASRLRPIDVSHVHPGGQSSVSSSVGPLQVPGRDQPGHARPAGTSPTEAGSTQCRVPLACEPARCMSKALTEVKVRWQFEQCAEVDPVHQLSQRPQPIASRGRLLLPVRGVERLSGIAGLGLCRSGPSTASSGPGRLLQVVTGPRKEQTRPTLCAGPRS